MIKVFNSFIQFSTIILKKHYDRNIKYIITKK